MSFADGDSLIENTTLSGNKAAVAGGGLFHDADGELRIVHATIWRNSAPAGGGSASSSPTSSRRSRRRRTPPSS